MQMSSLDGLGVGGGCKVGGGMTSTMHVLFTVGANWRSDFFLANAKYVKVGSDWLFVGNEWISGSEPD